MRTTLFFLFLSLQCFGQNLVGIWKINALLGVKDENEYQLTSIDSAKRYYTYGNKLQLDAKGTFTSNYSADCGNDCFTTSSGTYQRIDSTHLRFYLKHISIVGDCKHEENSFEKDLGIFYISQKDKYFKLIKSDGIFRSDSLNEIYSNFIDQYDQSTSNIYNLYNLSWFKTDAQNVQEIVSSCLNNFSDLKIENTKVLFSKSIRGMFLVTLIDVSSTQYFVYFDKGHKNVALVDFAK